MILVLRALGIGDLATAVPALRALRSAFPDHPLGLAAPGWLAPLVALTGAVDRHLPVDGLTRLPATGRPPHLAVNLHGRGPQSHRVLRAARPGGLLAFACAVGGHPDGPRWRRHEHEAERWCRMLGWYGVPADPEDLRLDPPPPGNPPAGATVVHPGARSAARRWPARRFAEVARALAGQGHRVVVTGSPAERPLATRVARLAGLPPDAVLAGAGLADLAATVAHARLLVSGDTGAAHLATGYRTHSVVLFGPVSPARWGPPPGWPEHRVLWHPELAGRQPGTGPDQALLAISVDEVLAAVADSAPGPAPAGGGGR